MTFIEGFNYQKLI